MDLEFGLEFSDPALRRQELDPLTRRETYPVTPIDPLLAAPVVDRLCGDAKVLGDIDHLAD